MKIAKKLINHFTLFSACIAILFAFTSCNSDPVPTDVSGSWVITSSMGIPNPKYNDEIYTQSEIKAQAAVKFISDNWEKIASELKYIKSFNITLPNQMAVTASDGSQLMGAVTIDNTYDSPKYLKFEIAIFPYELAGVAVGSQMEFYYPKKFILDKLQMLIDEGKIVAEDFDYDYYNSLFSSLYAVVLYQKSSTSTN